MLQSQIFHGINRILQEIYSKMHAKKGFVKSSLKMDMSLVMSPESLKNMRGIMPHMISIVHALKMWRNYLMGKKFESRIDHSGLKYLFEQPNLNTR
jgi:hypothetical protein